MDTNDVHVFPWSSTSKRSLEASQWAILCKTFTRQLKATIRPGGGPHRPTSLVIPVTNRSAMALRQGSAKLLAQLASRQAQAGALQQSLAAGSCSTHQYRCGPLVSGRPSRCRPALCSHSHAVVLWQVPWRRQGTRVLGPAVGLHRRHRLSGHAAKPPGGAPADAACWYSADAVGLSVAAQVPLQLMLLGWHHVQQLWLNETRISGSRAGMAAYPCEMHWEVLAATWPANAMPGCTYKGGFCRRKFARPLRPNII